MDCDAEWARCEPWIDAALAHAGRSHSTDDVKAMVRAGEARLWPGERSALVTQVQDFPRAKWLLIWLGGGELAEIRDVLVPRAEAYAGGIGCNRTVIMGRPGWARVLPGYAIEAVIAAKELRA